MTDRSTQLKAEMQKKVAATQQDVKLKFEAFQKKLPNVSPMMDVYVQEGNVLYDEIQSDPTLKHICDAL